MIQVHPTSIPGEDKLRLMSESIRGEGGRIWVPRDGKPWYFLEERYPKFENLVPRDVATREIFQVCREMGLGVDGKDQVYLDVTHIPADVLRRKIGGVIEMYEKFVGDDPTKVPMRIFPGMHYSMGGLWVDFEANDKGDIVPSPRNQQTNIPGLYATGRVRLPVPRRQPPRRQLAALVHLRGHDRRAGDGQIRPERLEEPASSADAPLEDARKRWRSRIDDIYKMKAAPGAKAENPYVILQELGDLMTETCTVIRYNDKLKASEQKISDLKVRWKRVANLDDSPRANQAVAFTNQLWNMLEMAHAMVKGALLRDECRGSHYKPDFDFKPAAGKKPQDDPAFMEKWRANLEKWGKTTIATYKPAGPEISYRPVSFPILKPEPRHYD